MKKTTEQLIKTDLLRLYNHIMKWYEDHPEGRRDSESTLDCYGSVTVGITYDEFSDKELSVANLILCGKPDEYVTIEAPINHMRIKHHREKSSKSEEKIVP
jgi:hypothetical protein